MSCTCHSESRTVTVSPTRSLNALGAAAGRVPSGRRAVEMRRSMNFCRVRFGTPEALVDMVYYSF